MSLSYRDTETVFSGGTGPATLELKTYTATGKYCYEILIESSATTDHARRIEFVKSLYPQYFANLPRSPKARCFGTVLAVLVEQGFVDGDTDADIQAAVNTIMDNLVGAS